MWDTPISPPSVSTFTSVADERTGSLNSGGFTGMFFRSRISMLAIFIQLSVRKVLRAPVAFKRASGSYQGVGMRRLGSAGKNESLVEKISRDEALGSYFFSSRGNPKALTISCEYVSAFGKCCHARSETF